MFVAPTAAPPKEAIDGGLLVLSWIQDQFLKATRSVSANVAHERATSANSWRVGLDMRFPLRNRPVPAPSRAVGSARSTGVRAPLIPLSGVVFGRPPD